MEYGSARDGRDGEGQRRVQEREREREKEERIHWSHRAVVPPSSFLRKAQTGF